MKTRIKEARLNLNMTQETLAQKANVDARQIQRIEKGKSNPRIDNLANIAKALQTTVGYLLYETDEK